MGGRVKPGHDGRGGRSVMLLESWYQGCGALLCVRFPIEAARRLQGGCRRGKWEEAMSKLQIHVGSSFEDTKHRALDAVARYERGADVEEHHLSFENWQTFARVMTANRLELLHHVHRNPPRSIQ